MSKDNPFRDRKMFELQEKLFPDTWEHHIMAKDGSVFGRVHINRNLSLNDMFQLKQDVELIITMLLEYEEGLNGNL